MRGAPAVRRRGQAGPVPVVPAAQRAAPGPRDGAPGPGPGGFSQVTCGGGVFRGFSIVFVDGRVIVIILYK